MTTDASTGASAPALRDAAREAFLFGLPLIEMAAARARPLAAGLAPNTVRHARRLVTPQSQNVTTPNNDTLYSVAWLDLANGPVTLTIPGTGARYFSLALMDMYSNNFAVLGTRTTGPGGGTFTLVGPAGAAADPLAVRAPTDWVWLLTRLLVDGDADLAAAHRVQDQIRVAGPQGRAPAGGVSRSAPWDRYFAAVQALMIESPPRATDTALLRRIAPLGLGPEGKFDAGRFSGADAAAIEDGVAAGRAALRARWLGRVSRGWIYPKSSLGDFGQDYLYRAQIAVGGLAALPLVEAMYMSPVGEGGGTRLDSTKTWRLGFQPDALPPVDGFWSITMYRVTDDGQSFIFDNPIMRHSIGDRTPGLRRGASGALELWLSPEDPGGERSANWLSAPKGSPFNIVFRAYLPRAELIDGSYLLPPLEAI